MVARFERTATGGYRATGPRVGRLTTAQVREVFRRHARQIALGRRAAIGDMLTVYEQAGRALLGRVTAYGQDIDRFSTLHYGNALGQVQAGIAEMWQRVGGALTANDRAGIDLAQRHLAERIGALSSHFEGTVRAFSTRPIELLLVTKPHDAGTIADILGTMRHASGARLSGDLLDRVRMELAVSLAAREPFFGPQSTVARIRGAIGVSHKRAEFIARTEHSRAYNMAHHTELVAANAEGGDYLKSAIIVHDSRTDEDSIGLEQWLADRGGAIPLDQMFVDGDGRHYLHPPGRTNDREVEIPWRRAWGGFNALQTIV